MDTWRLILDPALSGAENMARDEALLRAAEQADEFTPVLRLYGWNEPSLSIGYAQDAAAFKSMGLPVVRRITGGRAVLHASEVTYSVTAPVSGPLFSGGAGRAYSVLSGCIVAALKDIGVEAELARGRRTGARESGKEACFYAPSRFEVMAGARKLVGSSQRRFKRAFLQHGSILMDIDVPLHERVFGPGLLARMTCVSSFSDAGEGELRERLVRRFAEGLGAGFLEGGLTPDEKRARDELKASRYSAAMWNEGGSARGRSSAGPVTG
jgi:lipoate-protein ligase A